MIFLQNETKEKKLHIKNLEDFAYFREEFDELQSALENTENYLRKNNIKFRGLKEQVEGDCLIDYLQHMFASCAGSECDTGLILSQHIGLDLIEHMQNTLLII